MDEFPMHMQNLRNQPLQSTGGQKTPLRNCGLMPPFNLLQVNHLAEEYTYLSTPKGSLKKEEEEEKKSTTSPSEDDYLEKQ